MKVRRYQNYSVVYLEEISVKEFQDSMAKYEETKLTDKYVVIRPTKKAIEQFTTLHSLTLGDCQKGDKYRLLGIQFEVTKVKDGLVTFSYFNHHQKKDTITEIAWKSVPISAVLIETLFQVITGKLLYC